MNSMNGVLILGTMVYGLFLHRCDLVSTSKILIV